jgi:hypothetical protein
LNESQFSATIRGKLTQKLLMIPDDAQISSIQKKIHEEVVTDVRLDVFSVRFPFAVRASMMIAAVTGLTFLTLSTAKMSSAPVRPQTVVASVSALDRMSPQLRARVEQANKNMHGAAESMSTVVTPVPESSAPAETLPSSESSAAASSASSVAPVIRSDNKMGVYLTASSIKRTDFFQSTIDSLIEAGGTAMVFDVKGSAVYFHSAAPMANEIGLVKPLYELPDIIRQLHEKNIYVIGRFISIKDAGLTEKKPETRIKNPKTGNVISETWVDPSNETAIEYNMQVMCELAAADIDEINLDYIRFSTAEFGALGVYSGEQKADHVEAFIKAARETINRCGPTTKLGLSTYAILGWDYKTNVETLGQDVVRFAPLVDVISPMAYPATFAEGFYYRPGKDPRSRMYFLVYRTLTGYEKLLGPDGMKKLRPWIQGYGVTTKDMTDQMDAVYDAGLCGFQVWSANNLYKPTYAAIKANVTRSERCNADVFAAAE